MGVVSEIVATAGALVAGEIRLAKREFQRAATGILAMAVACAILLAALGFLLASAYLAMAASLGATLAALLTGSGTLVLALVVGAVAHAVTHG